MKPMRAGMLLALLFGAGLGCSAAFAQHGHGDGRGGGRGGAGPGWHGDGARPHGYSGGGWRGGHWAHGAHGGRYGWWWVAGPSWYYYPYYPGPVYPYAYPYAYAYPYSLPPPEVGVAPLAPSAQYWYYCDATRSYYPYETQCPGGWRALSPSDPNVAPPAPGVQ